jgi:acetyl-CoA carboxylase biotin carboxyl carrier protein
MEERHAEELRTLRELLEVMNEHDLDTIKVKLGDAVYELSRRGQNVPIATFAGPPPAAATDAPSRVADPNLTKVLAPLTGVFYRSPSPDAAPFVEPGDRIGAGDVVCVLEAMKLFNEIQSDYGGTIVRILPENGELVSQGDELLWIDPRS